MILRVLGWCILLPCMNYYYFKLETIIEGVLYEIWTIAWFNFVY